MDIIIDKIDIVINKNVINEMGIINTMVIIINNIYVNR